MILNADIRPIAGSWGVEVAADLRDPLEEEQQRALRDLFNRHHLLVFRDQRLSMDDQVRVASYIGPVVQEAGTGSGVVSNVAEGGIFGEVELSFHYDGASCPEPFQALALHAVDIVGSVTPTRYANMLEAYRATPVELRQRVAGLECVNATPRILIGRSMDEVIPDPSLKAAHPVVWHHPETGEVGFLDRLTPDSSPRAVHPVVWHHPVTGEPGFMVGRKVTTGITGMSEAESDSLLEELFSHMYRAENIYEHHWHLGDLVIWDNIAVQHARAGLEHDGVRTLQRVLLGRKGFFEQHPHLFEAVG